MELMYHIQSQELKRKEAEIAKSYLGGEGVSLINR